MDCQWCGEEIDTTSPGATWSARQEETLKHYHDPCLEEMLECEAAKTTLEEARASYLEDMDEARRKGLEK